MTLYKQALGWICDALLSFLSTPTKMYAALLGLLAATPLVAGANNKLKVIPIPAKYTSGDDVVCLSSSFSISVSSDGAPEDLKAAISRAQDTVVNTNHTWLTRTQGSEFFSDYSAGQAPSCSSTIDSLVLSFEGSNGTVSSIFDDATSDIDQRMELEKYTLSVPSGGQATLKAGSSLGLFRGLSTFQQLSYGLPDSGNTVYTPNAPVDITDEPSFAWRSLMLDTSRHYLPKSLILKQLDAMALVKLSVFHW